MSTKTAVAPDEGATTIEEPRENEPTTSNVEAATAARNVRAAWAWSNNVREWVPWHFRFALMAMAANANEAGEAWLDNWSLRRRCGFSSGTATRFFRWLRDHRVPQRRVKAGEELPDGKTCQSGGAVYNLAAILAPYSDELNKKHNVLRAFNVSLGGTVDDGKEPILVSCSARFVFAVLLEHLGKDDLSFPSYNTIAKRTGIGKTEIAEGVNELEALGLITTEILAPWDLYPTKNPAKLGGAVRTILPQPDRRENTGKNEVRAGTIMSTTPGASKAPANQQFRTPSISGEPPPNLGQHRDPTSPVQGASEIGAEASSSSVCLLSREREKRAHRTAWAAEVVAHFRKHFSPQLHDRAWTAIALARLADGISAAQMIAAIDAARRSAWRMDPSSPARRTFKAMLGSVDQVLGLIGQSPQRSQVSREAAARELARFEAEKAAKEAALSSSKSSRALAPVRPAWAKG